MQDDVKVAVEHWLAKAKNDLRTAETLVAIEEPVIGTVCFLHWRESIYV